MSSVKVLLVEDDEDDYILIKDLLLEIPHREFHLHWASTYQEGLDAMEADDHDVCLLDFRLGKESGLDMLKVAKERNYLTPIIFLTVFL